MQGGMYIVGPLMMAIDTNKDGELSAEEIANASANLAKLDKNGDGKISREELFAAMGRSGSEGGQANFEEIRKRLMAFDKDGDGKISKEEAPPFLAANFDALDTDKDGKLDENELKGIGERMRVMAAQRAGAGGDRAAGDRPARGDGDRPARDGDRPATRDGGDRPARR